MLIKRGLRRLGARNCRRLETQHRSDTAKHEVYQVPVDRESARQIEIWGPSTRAMVLSVLCSSITLSLSCYSSNFDGDFVYDDNVQLTNRDVLGDSELRSLFLHDYWGQSLDGELWTHKSYRPLTVMSLRFTYSFAGSQPWYFHVTDALVHGLNAFLVFLVSFQLMGELRIPTAAAILFAVHPIHVDAVANISGRAEVLSGCFALLALCLAVYNREKGTFRNHSMALAACCISGLCKEQGAMSFISVFAVDLVHLASCVPIRELIQKLVNNNSGCCSRMVASTVTGCAFIWFRLWITGGSTSMVFDKTVFNPISLMDPWQRFLNAANVWSFYAGLHIFQSSFSASHSTFPLVQSIKELPVQLSFFLLGVTLYVFLWLPKHKERAFVHLIWLVWSISNYLPASQLLLDVGFVVAERVMYQPSAGVIVILTDIFSHEIATLSNWFVLKGEVFFPTGEKGQGPLKESFRSTSDTRTSPPTESRTSKLIRDLLFLTAVSSYLSNCVRGAALFNTEVTLFENCTKMYPTDPTCLHGVAWGELSQGNYAKGVEWIETLTKTNPTFTRGRWLQAITYHRLGRHAEAENDFLMLPMSFFGQTDFGCLLVDLGRDKEAAEHMSLATSDPQLRPGSSDYCIVWNNVMCSSMFIDEDKVASGRAAAQLAMPSCFRIPSLLVNYIYIEALLGNFEVVLSSIESSPSLAQLHNVQALKFAIENNGEIERLDMQCKVKATVRLPPRA